jgi:hypothetical protein
LTSVASTIPAASGGLTAAQLAAGATVVGAAAPLLLTPKIPKISAPPGGSILSDYDAARKAARAKMRAMGSSGKASTILTGESGDVPSYGGKTLLGQ